MTYVTRHSTAFCRVQVAPLAFFWWLYVVSGVTALRYLNVPMYRCAWLAGCIAAARVDTRLVAVNCRTCSQAPQPAVAAVLGPCSVIRRSTTLLVVSGEFWMFNKRPTRRSLAALLLMVCGAVVAGITDLTFNLPG